MGPVTRLRFRASWAGSARLRREKGYRFRGLRRLRVGVGRAWEDGPAWRSAGLNGVHIRTGQLEFLSDGKMSLSSSGAR